MRGPFGGREAARISRSDPGEQGWRPGTTFVCGEACRTVTAPRAGSGAPACHQGQVGQAPSETTPLAFTTLSAKTIYRPQFPPEGRGGDAPGAGSVTDGAVLMSPLGAPG